MLANLHIQNIGLIDEVKVNFRQGLNILTGETGAGKSMIIGSMDALLGGEMSKSLRREEDSFIEGLFLLEKKDSSFFECLKELGLAAEDELIISRKISGGRSVFRCNGEMVSKATILEIRKKLLDIHSQREHQALLQVKNHGLWIDRYFSKEVEPLLQRLKEFDLKRKEIEKKQNALNMDESARLREIDFLQFEISEIEDANLKEGEDAKLEEELEVLQNSHQIKEVLQNTVDAIGGDYGSRNRIAEVTHQLQRIKDYDEKIAEIWEELVSAEDILQDAFRQADRYLDRMDGFEDRLFEAEKRMDVIHSMKAKYGNEIGAILKEKQHKEERLAKLENMEVEKQSLEKEKALVEKQMKEAADKLTEVRKQSAKSLEQQIRQRLLSLNFNNNQFEVRFATKANIQADGQDEMEFYISTNKGEQIKPLVEVASGGELSRIMLALKGTFAGVDEIPSLIFDEIDTGISGITAGMVGEQMKQLAASKQIFAITHLPQIASLGDAHYIIFKEETKDKTRTHITELDSEARVKEIARLLGGKSISKAVEDTAREMLGLS